MIAKKTITLESLAWDDCPNAVSPRGWLFVSTPDCVDRPDGKQPVGWYLDYQTYENGRHLEKGAILAQSYVWKWSPACSHAENCTTEWFKTIEDAKVWIAGNSIGQQTEYLVR